MVTERLIETATVSLHRYQKLEKIERAFNSGFKVSVRNTGDYYSRDYILLSESEAVNEISKAFKKLEGEVSTLKGKERKLELIENSTIFKLFKRWIPKINCF